jgi:pimeloyl-ACP methyl ester carboxylesterase
MKIQDFEVQFQKDILAAREFMPQNPIGDVLIMHGAGESSQERSRALAEGLMHEGYRVVTFDFTSHGHSTGKLEDLSLEKRQQEAEAIIKYYRLQDRLMVIGFSMSGQTAIDLIGSVPLETLVLFVPAIYDKQARKAAFGSESEFTRLIRRPDSWQDSDAWVKVETFKGNCLIFQGEFDQVIPEKIPVTIYKHANKTQKRLHVKILGAGHALAKWIIEEPKKAEWFARAIRNFQNNELIDTNNNQNVGHKIVKNENYLK